MLKNGMFLRLLSALEVMEAGREAEGLVREDRERALCANACLLARALEDEGREPLFASGLAVLTGLTVDEIAALAERWDRLHREAGPGLDLSAGELENVKKNSAAAERNGCAGGS